MDGFSVKKLTTYPDERGMFRELMRSTDAIFGNEFGQLSHAVSHAGVIKAWHGHKQQTQWTYVLAGALKVVLYDSREDSKTYMQKTSFMVGDLYEPIIYSFVPGILHGYVCVNGPAHVIYVTSGIYNPEEDEVRVPLAKIGNGIKEFEIDIT